MLFYIYRRSLREPRWYICHLGIAAQNEQAALEYYFHCCGDQDNQHYEYKAEPGEAEK